MFHAAKFPLHEQSGDVSQYAVGRRGKAVAPVGSVAIASCSPISPPISRKLSSVWRIVTTNFDFCVKSRYRIIDICILCWNK